MASIAGKLVCTADTLCERVRQAKQRAGPAKQCQPGGHPAGMFQVEAQVIARLVALMPKPRAPPDDLFG